MRNKREAYPGAGVQTALALCSVADISGAIYTTPWSHQVADTIFFSKLQRLVLGALSVFSLSPHSCFCSCLKASASLSSWVYGEGTSLLASMDILTADTRWPLAYGNSVKAQPGLIVTSAVLGEVFGEVQPDKYQKILTSLSFSLSLLSSEGNL